MIIDLANENTALDETIFPTDTIDLLLIGGGIAAMTLANELSKNTGMHICILESGGFNADEDKQQLNDGYGDLTYDLNSGPLSCNINDHIQSSRVRGFGGCCNLWGGKSAEFDSVDFEVRRWITNSGWPISYDELKPYYKRACYSLELPPFNFQGPNFFEENRPPYPLNNHQAFTTATRRYTAIGGRANEKRWESFKRAFYDTENVQVYLNATVTHLENSTDSDGKQQVTAANVALPNGQNVRLTANTFILSAGGLENARLLLNSPTDQGHSLGNQHDVVGRFFNGHMTYKRHHAAHSDNPENTEHFFTLNLETQSDQLKLYLDKDLQALNGIFSLGKKAQRRYKLNNFSATLDPIINEQGEASSEKAHVFFMGEQQPNPASRVTLVEEKDAMGVPKLHLDWRFQHEDVVSLLRSIALFAQEAKKGNLGTMDINMPEKVQSISDEILHKPEEIGIDLNALLLQPDFSRHQMGTTRMNPDPSLGVVDTNSKVHNVDNLYVIGLSVFPTGGVANPTLTILALVLRLAEQLGAKSN